MITLQMRMCLAMTLDSKGQTIKHTLPSKLKINMPLTKTIRVGGCSKEGTKKAIEILRRD